MESKKLRGWPGFGMVTVGMDPNKFEVLNGHPNKIPTDKILGGVVQNCLQLSLFIKTLEREVQGNEFVCDRRKGLERLFNAKQM